MKHTFRIVITLFSLIGLFCQLAAQGKKEVKTINLTGNSREAVVIMGFPDRDTAYPRLTNSNKQFPLLGVFPDGTLLTDFIDKHGGAITADKWYGPALNHFYNVYSGGRYNVNFDFIRKPDGRMYLTDDPIKKWIDRAGQAENVIWNNWTEMATQAAEKIVRDHPNAFKGATALHIVFAGMPKTEFNTAHGGTVEWNGELKDLKGRILYKGPVSIQRDINAIAHERMHLIGQLAGAPQGFNGFPDRGFDIEAGEGHYNIFYGYDMMYHNAAVVSQYSLYGLPPIISHDLIFLGWIRPEEILTVSKSNYKKLGSIKLLDVNYPLTKEQLKKGFRRVVKIMIRENYSNGLDEYFLLEYHRGSEFDKNMSNYDEFPERGYNKGMLIWHVKEKTPMINTFSDNMIDLELAVPYNAFYGHPVPDDNYPRGDYKRPENYNGIFSGEYDYLDDGKMDPLPNGGNVFKYIPDGGRAYWEVTTKGLDWEWWPNDKKLFPRLQSMSTDFFSDEKIKGRKRDEFTPETRPSTATWGGDYGKGFEPPARTGISVKEIKLHNGYMTAVIEF